MMLFSRGRVRSMFMFAAWWCHEIRSAFRDRYGARTSYTVSHSTLRPPGGVGWGRVSVGNIVRAHKTRARTHKPADANARDGRPTLRRHTLLNGSAHGLDSGVVQVHPEAASTSPLAALAALQVLQWHPAHRGR
eukprot:scaffold73990_cov74-Phaeocystis_antarctica.AAC.6